MAGTAGPHFRGVCIKHTGIVGLPVLHKEFHNLRVNLITVILAGLHGHADTSVRLKGTLKGFVGLKAYNGFLVLIQISRAVGGNGGNDFCIHIQDSAGFLFFF